MSSEIKVTAHIDPSTGFFASPYSLLSIPDDVKGGMVAMGVLGLFSFLSTFGLFLFITYRMIYWRKYYDAPISSHQFIVLIFNLLLADLQQALSFLFSFHWLHMGNIMAPSNACFTQGWLIQIGDLSSGIWVLAIGFHTFYGLVSKTVIPYPVFVCIIIGVWAFCLTLTLIGPATHPDDFFVNAGVWCWISSDYEAHRLYLHYVWIFIAELGSLIIYAFVFTILRRRLTSLAVPAQFDDAVSTMASQSSSMDNAKLGGAKAVTTTTVLTNNKFVQYDPFAPTRQRVSRAAKYMVAYPAIYVALTIPLAAGRLAAMTGTTLSLVYYCAAGSMMASCGFVDVILYVTTRKALVGTHGAAERRRKTQAPTGFLNTFKSLFVQDGGSEQLNDERTFGMDTFNGTSRSKNDPGKTEKVLGMGMGWGGIRVERRVSLSKQSVDEDKQLDLERISSERRLVPAEVDRSATRAVQTTPATQSESRGSWGASASPSITDEPGKSWEAVS